MKHAIIIFISFITIPCSGQWRNGNFDGYNGHVAAFGVHDTSLFIAEIQENGGVTGVLIRYSVGTHSYVESQTGIDPTQGIVTSFASLGTYLFAGTTGSGGDPGPAYCSTGNGSHWVSSGTASPVATNGRDLFAQYVLPSQIVRSTDSGQNWEVKANLSVSSFAAIGINIFANTGSAIWRSTDTGNNWTQLSPSFAGTMTVMGTLLFIVSSNSQLEESTDIGTDWGPIAVDSASVPVTVSVLATDGKNLFAGTNKGLMFSTDTGQHWTPQNYGLDYDYIFHNGVHLTYNIDALVDVDSFVFADVQYSNGYGYLAYRPISEITGPPDAVQLLPVGDTILIFPNPTTSQVSIRSGGTSILAVRVLNVLGETVLNMAAKREDNVTLDLSKLPSGTYFLQIQTANGSILRKVIRE